ncbi:MAG TPA: FixH family protein [Phycisphaerales bacterium]|nr:FixH family protein [Phycisphaerales bacterium]HMP38720.1 FixH family protein [Phycisphaerales bacterium]
MFIAARGSFRALIWAALWLPLWVSLLIGMGGCESAGRAEATPGEGQAAAAPRSAESKGATSAAASSAPGGAAPGAPVAASGAVGPALEGRRIESNDGSYVVIYTTRPAPIPTNETFEVDVVILDARRGQALVSDAELFVDAAMPHHRHGMNVVPVVRKTNDGGYVARGMLFHMPGRWELYFDITRRGATERAQDVVFVD